MSFLAPLFLFGAAAIALPIVFHLVRRTTRDRTVFSSLMFLKPSPPRLTRRSRFEHLLLLALRCLVLCLLAFGFSRPFIKKAMLANAPSAGSRKLVLLVDSSASMRRADLWSSALARAKDILRETHPGDQVAVYTFDRQLHSVMSFEDWSAVAPGERAGVGIQKLSTAGPGWGATRLGDALIGASELLADTGATAFSGPREIRIVSDLQEGSRAESLQGYEWPRGIQVEFEPLKARHAGNASLHLATEGNGVETPVSNDVRLRVSNSMDASQENLKVGWGQTNGRAFAAPPVDVYVPRGQSRVVNLARGEKSTDRIILQGDQEDFDNTVFVAPSERSEVHIVFFGADSGADSKQPLFFLQKAFQETRRQKVQLLISSPAKPLTPADLSSASLIIAAGGLSGPDAGTIRALVNSGKTLLLALRTESDGAALASILELPSIKLQEARSANYAMLANIDFKHPLFAAFADPRFSDFTKIHFWNHRALNLADISGARAVASFDNGDPAIFEVPKGKGRAIVLTSSWQTDDSQLALSTKFVPLLYSLLEQSGPASTPAQYYVGDTVTFPSSDAAAASGFTVRTPNGASAAGETNFSQTTIPGIYMVSSGQMQSLPPIAVNLDPSESRTVPMPIDEFERLGVPLLHKIASTTSEATRQARFQDAELESRQKLWRWLLIATMAVLLGETWLAGRTARRLAVQGGAA